MIRAITAAVVAVFLASPAFAQKTPANNGLSGLNERGTLGDAPCYGKCGSPPSDCTATDLRPGCQQASIPDQLPSNDRGSQGYDVQTQQQGVGRFINPRPPEGPTSGN